MSGSKHHLDIKQWLCNLDLQEYGDLFFKYGGVEDMLWMSERELKNLGIRNGSHRARMMTSLVMLKEKYEKGSQQRSGGTPPSKSSPRRASPQENPLYHKPLTHRILGQRSWPCSGPSSHRSSMEPRMGTEASPEELKKALEWELGLDNSDIRSYAWYHGTIPRQRAEELMKSDGDFLIRDCISQPGDYVLTCQWQGMPLHYIVSKVIVQPNTVYEKIEFHFENEKFDTVPGLVTFFVGNKSVISSATGAIIIRPVNRNMPLTYYASRYGLECQILYVARALENIPANQKKNSAPTSPSRMDAPDVNPQSALQTKRTSESFSKGDISIPEKQNGAVSPRYSSDISTHIQLQTSQPQPSLMVPKPIVRVSSDPSLSPTMEWRAWKFRPHSGTLTTETRLANDAEDKPPPKPSRVPSKKCSKKPFIIKRDINSKVNYSQTESVCESEESGYNSEGTHNVSDIYSQSSKVISKKPKARKNSGETRFSFLDRPSLSEMPPREIQTNFPLLDPPSSFSIEKFASTLLPEENKPLDSSVLNMVKYLLLDSEPQVLACHMTKIDLDLMRCTKETGLGLGVTSGLELMLLPQGKQLRLDLIEREDCMKLFVATTILTCNSEEERAKIISRWIEVAVATKSCLGNMYGFANIMQGLTMYQVGRLHSTWHFLRQSNTNSTFYYETKLRPALKAMQECSSQNAPNTCIPYVKSLISMLHHHLEVIENFKDETFECEQNENIMTLGIPLENTSSDYGLQVILAHLELGRDILHQYSTFIKNGEMVLADLKYDTAILDMFMTEFHLKFLWGSRGAAVSAKERHSKFTQVLNVLSQRCENT